MGIIRALRAMRNLVYPSYGLNFLDRKLAKYLPPNGGFFVEAGANNGLLQSNSLYMERHRGWTGMLIEAIPVLAEQCKINRPKCIVEQYALVAPDYPDTTITMHYANLMSLTDDAMKNSSERENHIRSGCEIQNVATYTAAVPTITLGALLERHAVTHVDLLSLDVEGYEQQVLRGIYFDRCQIDTILVEARYEDEIDAILLPRYRKIARLSHHDIVYRATNVLQTVV